MKKQHILRVLVLFAIVLMASACGPKNGDNSSNGGSGTGDNSGNNNGGSSGPSGPSVNFLHVDLTDASALVTFQDSSGALADESAKALTVPGYTPKYSISSGVQQLAGVLYRITHNGSFQNGLRTFQQESTAKFDDTTTAGIDTTRLKGLPHVSLVAISPCGDTYLALEHPTVFTDTVKIKGTDTKIADYPDAYSPSSPFSCEFFKVKQKVGAYAATDRIQKSNLECITNTYDSSGNFVNKLELNTWDFRSGQIKFDDACNLYFSAHVPGNWKNVLIRRDHTTGSLTEVINANICYREYVVTGDGGVLYTGVSSADSSCQGTSFFRYVSPASRLFEITRGWWDYSFKPITRGTDKGKIIFYGPSTVTSTLPSWNTACLYKFDPTASDDTTTTAVDERTSVLADCNSDLFGYVNQASDLANQKSRCTETKFYLNSGEAPKDILLADRDGNGTDETYFIGKIQQKKAGTWLCNICVNADHCYSGNTPDPTKTTQGTCTAAGKTWAAGGPQKCYNDLPDSVCSATLLTTWNITSQNCQSPGNDWASTYEALAQVNADKAITRLSGTGEEVTAAWIVTRGTKTELYYSSFTTGIHNLYKLQSDGTAKLMIKDFEVTKLTRDPAASSTLLFLNGLRFSDNSYVVGTFDPDAADPQGSLSTETKLTGTIDTMVIVQ